MFAVTVCPCFFCASSFWSGFCSCHWRASSVPYRFFFCFAIVIEFLGFFQVLVSKDWCAFGHRFAARSGHGRDAGGETSPIFPQFLDATYQLLRQFPTSFEFSENLLILLLHAYHSRWDPRFRYGPLEFAARRFGMLRVVTACYCSLRHVATYVSVFGGTPHPNIAYHRTFRHNAARHNMLVIGVSHWVATH